MLRESRSLMKVDHEQEKYPFLLEHVLQKEFTLKNIQWANALSNGDSYVMLHSAYLFFFFFPPPGSYIFNLLSCQTVFNKIKIRT